MDSQLWMGYSPAQRQSIEAETQRIGRNLFERLEDTQPNLWERRFWDDRILSWSMYDEAVKVQLFRFVDALPTLPSDDSVALHLAEYLESVRHRIPSSVSAAMGLATRTPLVRNAVARFAQLASRDFAKRFIAGANHEQVVRSAWRERQKGRCFTLDILGEAVLSEREALGYMRSYSELLSQLPREVNIWPNDPLLDRDASGTLPRANVSIKLSALDPRFDPIDPKGVLKRAGSRLRELCRIAMQSGAQLHVDMESYEKKDLTIWVFKEVLNESEFRDWSHVGIVIQCYLRDAANDLVSLCDWAKRRGAPIHVRLVKGAYWDYETVHARARGWPVPVFSARWETDASFEAAVAHIMKNAEWLRPAIGSHNLRSIAHSMAVAKEVGVPNNAFEVQMLYGMADAEKRAVVDLGHRLRIYMPFGELLPGMAYLVRRLLENTSNDSFIRAGFLEHAPVDSLLKKPSPMAPKPRVFLDELESTDAKLRRSPQPLPEASGMKATFANHPPIDFSREIERKQMQDAIERVAGLLGNHYPLQIGEDLIDTDEKLTRFDPSRTERLVGATASASPEHATKAVELAHAAAANWRKAGVTVRTETLRAAAKIMRERLFDLAAWEVYEVGKTWREATADVDEAIDFLDFYASCAEDLMALSGADVPGEENRFEFIPRGVTAVIAPWNFPLAILTGMTSAALATGNPVIMKPAEQSGVIAALFHEILLEAGIPSGVVHYLPGKGEVVGDALVKHPRVAMIAYTGSRSVGLSINASAALASVHSPYVKRVVAELGGKNAIIVDEDADLDEAVAGIVGSAFGFQGQKCSACSRVIVVGKIYESILERIVEAAKSLPIGPAEDPGTAIGPVVDSEARERILKYIEIGKKESRTALAIDVGPLGNIGNFVGPHVFADVKPSATIAREEIFGPILAVIRAASFDEALTIANDSDYALTGGVFSRSPKRLAQARENFEVGNLYLNRGITGALVGRQPFGGYRMSGIGSKAGSRDYLLQYVIPRTITENTLRRGFAPEQT